MDEKTQFKASAHGLRVVLPSKRSRFHVMREKAAIDELIDGLPGPDEVFKLLSFGAFSSIGLIRYVADRGRIEDLTVSSLAVGADQAMCLDVLAREGKIGKARFFVGSVMGMDRRTKTVKAGIRDRAVVLSELCRTHDWEAMICRNHSKIILMRTAIGHFVVETSSNLNENPKFEQFSFENNEALYKFYEMFFDELTEGERG